MVHRALHLVQTNIKQAPPPRPPLGVRGPPCPRRLLRQPLPQYSLRPGPTPPQNPLCLWPGPGVGPVGDYCQRTLRPGLRPAGVARDPLLLLYTPGGGGSGRGAPLLLLLPHSPVTLLHVAGMFLHVCWNWRGRKGLCPSADRKPRQPSARWARGPGEATGPAARADDVRVRWIRGGGPLRRPGSAAADDRLPTPRPDQQGEWAVFFRAPK